MNLFCVFNDPVNKKTGDNFILVGEKIGDIIDPIYLDQFGNLYVPSGTIKFDYQGRYWYVGEMLITYGGSANYDKAPVSIGFSMIKYNEKGQVRYVGKMRVGFDYHKRVSYIVEDMPVYYRGTGYSTDIATIGYNDYYPYFNASAKFYR